MARIPKCMCKNCNNVGVHKINIDKRGGGNGYLCDFHFYNEEGYSQENGFRYGNRKQNGFTFSIELETSNSDAKARAELADFGFIPTSDCTVDVEYKSPIYEGLNAISKQVNSIQKLMDEGHLEINRTCGTHFHCGHAQYINPETMGYIRRFYHSIFVPLSDWMVNHPEQTTKFWGRGFEYDGWAQPITANSNPEAHRNFVNMEHGYTVEFRLCKFQNADQYMQVVKFCKDATAIVIKNFVEHFNEEPKDARRYPNKTAYRQHKAKVAAEKILKKYKEYTANI